MFIVFDKKRRLAHHVLDSKQESGFFFEVF